MMTKLKGSYHLARREDDQRRSLVQQVWQKRIDFPRRIIVPVEGQGVTLSYVCPHCHRYPREDYLHLVGLDGAR